jgi:hypothetical protein
MSDHRKPTRHHLEYALTFAFCSPIVRDGRGNGKRPRVLQNRARGKAATGSIALMALTSRLPSVEIPSHKRGEGSACKTIPRSREPSETQKVRFALVRIAQETL